MVKESQRTTGGVPSLYVRVYRFDNADFSSFTGSLTVCEGVSSSAICRVDLVSFPHCM